MDQIWVWAILGVFVSGLLQRLWIVFDSITPAGEDYSRIAIGFLVSAVVMGAFAGQLFGTCNDLGELWHSGRGSFGDTFRSLAFVAGIYLLVYAALMGIVFGLDTLGSGVIFYLGWFSVAVSLGVLLSFSRRSQGSPNTIPMLVAGVAFAIAPWAVFRGMSGFNFDSPQEVFRKLSSTGKWGDSSPFSNLLVGDVAIWIVGSISALPAYWIARIFCRS